MFLIYLIVMKDKAYYLFHIKIKLKHRIIIIRTKKNWGMTIRFWRNYIKLRLLIKLNILFNK